jgi:thymidine kinase
MFSGKTSELFRRIKTQLVSDQKAILLTHGLNKRYAGSTRELTASHDGSTMKADKIMSLSDAIIPEGTTVIGIDEGQFFEGLAEFCLEQNRLGSRVIVAALNHEATPNRNVWPNVVPLIGFAHITTITAVCTICHAPALCSRRLDTSKGIPAVGTIDIGGNDKFIATCSNCYDIPIPEKVIEKRKTAVELIKSMTTV